MPYIAKNELVQAKQLRVQRLALPFQIVGNATPASVAVTCDEPAILFLKTEGVNRITLAEGAVDSSAELSAITFVAASDANGRFNALVKVAEPIAKVLSAQVQRMDTAELVAASLTTAPATGITSAGDKIVLNIDCAADFSTSITYKGVLIVEYEASPR